MSGVTLIEVAETDDGVRLDRWFKRHYPALSHGRLEKLLRTGQVRVDGGRAKGNLRLAAGQEVRVPPLGAEEAGEGKPKRPARPLSADERRFIRSLVIHEDEALIVLNKPSGLAVQGGSGTTDHIDRLLPGLAGRNDEPLKLVHRLDRDTSGVLVVGKGAQNTAALARAFQQKTTEKVYWALTLGVPPAEEGIVDLPLEKRGRPGEERMETVERGEGQKAITEFRIIDRAASKIAWLEFRPVTGRTHQIRAHALALGTPILGDGKYGGAYAHPEGNIPGVLHLHARRLTLPHPKGGKLTVTAPLPPHMEESFDLLEFNVREGDS